MLKIRRTSWHYRLWKLGRQAHTKPRDLCRYFWHLLIVKLLLPLVGAAFVLLGIGSLIYVIWGHPLESAMIVVGILLAVALVVGLVLLIRKLYERHLRLVKERSKLPPEPEPEPSVLFTYLAARKKKLCPLIEVVDDKSVDKGPSAEVKEFWAGKER